MGYAELIQRRLPTLSPEKQAEVYDFVEFIAARAAKVVPTDWTNESFSRFSMLDGAGAARTGKRFGRLRPQRLLSIRQ